ncbi:MAG: hypothetical protein H0Z24_06975 [Thermosipho sp. (in: Bacteria)]|nr:hypothetical protein [Thermosipho sp. (in: thermotogales)]
MDKVNEFLIWEKLSRDTIDVKRIYIDIADDLVAGILLSQIVFWYLPKKNGDKKVQVEKEGRMWIAKGRDDWYEECRISPKQFDRASKILKEKGLIEKKLFKFNNIPTIHISLNFDVLIEKIKKEYEKQEIILEIEETKKENAVTKEKEEKNKWANRSPEELKEIESLTKLLIEKILKNNDRAKVPKEGTKQFENWMSEIEKLNRLGLPGCNKGYSFDEIRKVIIWCQNDDFWKRNILSAKKLREKFDKLFLSANFKPNTSNRNKFHNFEQRTSKYTKQDLDEIARRKFEEALENKFQNALNRLRR